MLVPGCKASVKTGLDNIGSYRHLFHGKRLGIITNHTAYNSSGKYIVDVFRSMDNVTITAFFSPEHGIRGVEEAGVQIESMTDPSYQAPVYSLYGKTRKPTRQMLENLDVLVFDIQDIGARFYTYIYTMSLAMEAAAEYDKRFVVLDRPNPINGLRVEGNILKPQFATFVGLYPVPVRHGMTAGELARMFNEQGWLKDGVKADLVVVPMKGWRRKMWYDRTGLKFIKPSPNMVSLETATVYPGLCLLEGTNVSEGRGTPLPFTQFGAPWIDSGRLAAELNRLDLPGIRFRPASFAPVSSKYKDQRCNGVKVIITNRDLLEPYFSGIMIVNKIYQMYPDKFQWKTGHFDRLCGTSTIREAITTQSSLEKLRESWQPELKSFLKIRLKYLMYPN
ncbi:MAG: DUF1343 domain-containing protein [Planctomycetes bacterium]|nr:DUF1343 domain-containing protein [Planctomycetota bacterium]